MTRCLGPFAAGDHLRVRRNTLYSHHCVYIGDERVVEFGGDWWNKSEAQIREVSFNEFARGLLAEVVKHDRPPRLAQWTPTALSAVECVERARFLAKMAEPGRYNLIGHNCEHVATWCATGVPESHQVRVGMYVNLFRGIITLFATARFRTSPRIVKFVVASSVFALLINWQYHWHARRFVREIDGAWLAYRAGQEGRG
jgi:hypothetical protein